MISACEVFLAFLCHIQKPFGLSAKQHFRTSRFIELFIVDSLKRKELCLHLEEEETHIRRQHLNSDAKTAANTLEM